MRLTIFAFLAVSPFTLAACTGASDATGDDSVAAGESNYTSEGGAGDGGASDAAAGDAGVADVAPFTVADATSTTPKLRFSIDGAPAVEAYQAEWTTVASGADRRFRLQGATPVAGGKPVLYLEFGRGAAFIEKGTYDCADMAAIALVLDTDGVKKVTIVDGAPQRACKVVVDEAVDVAQTTGVRMRSWRNVVGHVEATVGDRTNAASDTKSVRAAFAVTVMER